MNKFLIKLFLSLTFFFILLFTLSCKIQTSENEPKKEETPATEVTDTTTTTEEPTEVFYTITFNSNNQAATGSTASIKAKADTTITLTTNGFALDGYNFTGWNTKPDGTGTGYADGAALKLTGDITLYAQWIKVYTISKSPIENGTATINVNNSVAGSEVVITLIPDELYDLDTIKVVCDDQSLITTNQDTNNGNIYKFYMPSQNVTITITYKYAAHSIVIQDSENGSVTTDKTVAKCGAKITLVITPLSDAFKLSNITITDTEGNNTTVTEEENSYYFIMPNNDVTITPLFERIIYTVTFDSNNDNATGTMTTQSILAWARVTLNENAYNLSDYSFLGWNTKRDGSGVSYANRGWITAYDNITLYAQWEIPTYTITIGQIEHGRIEVNKQYGQKGDEVIVSVTPDYDYYYYSYGLGIVADNQEPVNRTKIDSYNYSFIIPDSNITLNYGFTIVGNSYYSSIGTISEVLKSMTNSGIVIISGECEENTIETIRESLIWLGINRPSIEVYLDLSEVTNLEIINFHVSSNYTLDNLIGITLPDSAKTIAYYAFGDYRKLIYIYSRGNKNNRSICI